jgi:hypothetical protein
MKPYTVFRNGPASRPIVIMEVPENLNADRAYLTFTPDEARDLVTDLSLAIYENEKENNEQG